MPTVAFELPHTRPVVTPSGGQSPKAANFPLVITVLVRATTFSRCYTPVSMGGLFPEHSGSCPNLTPSPHLPSPHTFPKGAGVPDTAWVPVAAHCPSATRERGFWEVLPLWPQALQVQSPPVAGRWLLPSSTLERVGLVLSLVLPHTQAAVRSWRMVRCGRAKSTVSGGLVRTGLAGVA